MKIRQGFVSNSSSSSFIIKKNNEKEELYEIIDFILQKKYPKKYKDENDIIKHKLNVIKDNGYDCVYFGTDIGLKYIKDVNGYLIVSTNVDYCPVIWDFLGEVEDHYIPKELKNYDSLLTCIENISNFFEQEPIQYNFKYNVVGEPAITSYSIPNSSYYCSDCDEDYWHIDNVTQCPKCRKDTDGDDSHYINKIRKEKIKHILK